ncbi:hypothetical protein K445DRAFT_23565 [Daldinia sp. EC12]|nr:hypothetical protein K445DRAFT_23565 [Daldinia sp. EC12]
MPPEIRAISIPHATWNLHRDTIVKLYLDDHRQLNELVNIMKTEHGFDATISQYEAQLRQWRIRRNLKVPEWRHIFRVIDSLPTNTKSRVVLCGRVIDEKTIRRARRNCHSKPVVAGGYGEIDTLPSQDVNSDASVEIQKPDGAWSQFLGESSVDHILALPEVTDSQMIGTYHESEMQALPLPTLEGSSSTPVNIDNYLLDYHVDRSSIDNLNLINSSSSLPNSEQLAVQTYNTLATPEFSFPDALFGNFLWRPYMWLWNLSFSEIDNQLTSWTIHPLAVQTGIVRQLERGQIFGNNYTLGYQDYSKIDSFLRNIKTLVPGALPQGQTNSMVMIDSREDANDKSLMQGLMFSIANNSAGFANILIASALLTLPSKSGTSLIQFLGSRPCHLTKAIAESLFRAAIENEDNSTLRGIVDTGLVDVNRVILSHQGAKYTAIERVVMLQNVTGTKILLNAKADLTRTSRYYDIMTLYMGGFSPRNYPPTIKYINKKWISFYKLIRQYAPSAILQWHVESSISWAWTIDAIRSSLALFAPLEHSKLVETGILYNVAREIEDTEALNIARQIHQICQQTGCGRCFDKQYGSVYRALFTSILHGRCELTKFLLPFCNDSYVLEALSISIRLRHRGLISFIMDSVEYLNHPIAYMYFKGDTSVPGGSLLHPLAEALLSNDALIMDHFERANIYKALSIDGLRDVLATAAEMNRIDYMQKLLQHFTTLKGSSLTTAFFIAIQKGLDDLSFKLLELGTSFDEVNTTINGNVYRGLPLTAAIRRRNFNLVHAMLDAGITMNGIDASTFLAMFELDDMPLFHDILRFFPHDLSVKSRELESDGYIDLLSRLYEAGQYALLDALIHRHCRSVLLERWGYSAIASGNTTLVQFLLSHRIIKLDGCTLGFAAETSNITMLQLLLGRMEIQTPLASIPFPLGHLISRDGHLSLACLDILLSSTIFHFKFEIDTATMSEIYSEGIIHQLGRAISISDKDPDLALTVAQKLLDAGCDANATTYIKRPSYEEYIVESALLQAIGTQNERLIRLLIDRGADVDAPAYMTVKQTPLQKAAAIGSLSIVKLLLERNVDVNARPAARSGGTALQYAAISGNCNIAAELLSRSAHLHTRPPFVNGRWPIEGAAEHGRLHMIEYLWIAKENMFLPEDCESGFEEKYCRRAMKLAEDNGHIACRDLIAEKAGLSIDDV